MAIGKNQYSKSPSQCHQAEVHASPLVTPKIIGFLNPYWTKRISTLQFSNTSRQDLGESEKITSGC